MKSRLVKSLTQYRWANWHQNRQLKLMDVMCEIK